MNRLAHSVDESIKTINLNDVLELLLALSNRLASNRGVAVEPKPDAGSLKLRTSPFFLMNLFWLCLDFAMDAVGDDKIVELVPQKTDARIQVFFKGLGGLEGGSLKPFPAEPERGLCDRLGAELEVNTANKEIIVRFTGDLDTD